MNTNEILDAMDELREQRKRLMKEFQLMEAGYNAKMKELSAKHSKLQKQLTKI